MSFEKHDTGHVLWFVYDEGVLFFKEMATIKQKRAVAFMAENGGNVSKAMRDAGYRHETAKVPSKLTNSKGFKEAAKPFVEQLEKEIQAALEEMTSKRKGANYNELSSTVQGFKKLQQLLLGEATDNLKIEVVESYA